MTSNKIAATVAIILLCFSGCDEENKGQAVDYGPVALSTDVNAALDAPVATMNPDGIKVGQYVHTLTTQDVGGGAAVQAVAESGFTVISRDDTTTALRAIVEEHSYTYGPNNAVSKVTKQHDVVLAKLKPASLPAASPTPAGSPSAASASPPPQPVALTASAEIWQRTLDALDPQRLLFQAKTDSNAVRDRASPSPLSDTVASLAGSIHKLDSTITLHDLKTWSETVSPPDAVRARANCGDVAGCAITLHHVTYNEVTDASDGTHSLTHVEQVLSPDVPYFATQQLARVQICIASMVAIGSSDSKTLLKQCTTVVDFCFETCTTPNAP